MKIFLVDLESVPTRYTCEWKWHVPALLRDNGFDVEVVEGDLDIPTAVTPGAFLNFGGTNMYKATQTHRLAELFTRGEIKAGDQIIFTDAWHPGIINVKYMSELLNIPVITHGLWHAGSYDPNDFLGRLVGDKPWIRHAEQAFIGAFTHNWLATAAHFDLMRKTYDIMHDRSFDRTGWPMEYTESMIAPKLWAKKENIIVFPHRIAPEKRLDLFHMLASRPELWKYQFCVAMEMNLSKTEYHELLQRAKFAVSFADQETLGISMYEAACAGACPLVPNRLSYTEMYDPMFKRADSVDTAVKAILEYEDEEMSERIAQLVAKLHHNFFSATRLIDCLKQHKTTMGLINKLNEEKGI
jgi:glycosyltransferase involved in cell wall biosynthesis